MIHDWVDHLEDTQRYNFKHILMFLKIFMDKRTTCCILGHNSTLKNIILSIGWGFCAVGFVHQEYNFFYDLLKVNSTMEIYFVHKYQFCTLIIYVGFDYEMNKNEGKYYPHLDDDGLYRHARLVTSAVIEKIHTIDWTIEILKMDTLNDGMTTNWYGFLGKEFKDTFGQVGNVILNGFVANLINHGVPYSLT
eukprot:Gb_03142 [translate_table: standard]